MRWTRPILLVVVPLLLVVGAGTWWLWSGRYVATENAYVKADIVQVSSEVAGRIVEVKVREHAHVSAGDVLLTVDAEPYAIALAKSEAELDQTRSKVAGFRAEYGEAEMELREAKSRIAFFEAQHDRQQQLSDKGVGFAFRAEEAQSNLTVARARVGVIEGKMARILTSLGGRADKPTEEHAMVREMLAQRDRARLDLVRTRIVASVSGRVVNAKLLPGEQIRAATPLFAIVSDAETWVEANFKETELTHVRPGQRATVILDIYPDVTLQARVQSISPATGAEFALLPPQNASGNWVKVVQRLPVRLKIEGFAGEMPLRAGMTATVSVDTERERKLSQIFGWSTASATDKGAMSKKAATR
ncbi:MAG: HlyD family secretion protein [Hyphomicrobiaceae bacterium]